MELYRIMQRSKVEGLEALRAVAAVMIILFHMVLLTKMQIPAYLDVVKWHFWRAVPLFYAISGFVLAYGYADQLSNRSQVIQFYIKRYFRIAPLFYVMIVVIALTLKVRGASSIGSFSDFLLNILLLFGLVPGKHESMVWGGWSIGVEILFYLLFPIIVNLASNLRSGILILLISLLVASGFYAAVGNSNMGTYAYMNAITNLPNFMSGIVAFLLWRHMGFIENKNQGRLLFGITIISALAVVYLPTTILSAVTEITGIKMDFYIWTLLFIGLILSVCLFPNRLVVNPLTLRMGRISFSLYLWHPLIVVLLTEVYLQIGNTMDRGFLSFCICSILTLSSVGLIAYYSFRWIELPGMKLAKKFIHTRSILNSNQAQADQAQSQKTSLAPL